MCVACCDPKKIEQIAAPNCMQIPASGSVPYRTERDALVIVTSGGHYTGTRLTVTRNDSSQSGDAVCRFSTQGGASAFIPGAGLWRIHNGGSTIVNVVVIDSYCGAAFRAYARTGYAVPTHSVITMDATPVSNIVLAANQNRSYLLIQSLAANTAKIYLSFGPAAFTASGIELVPGQAYEMAGDNLWRGVINGILPSATAGQKLLVTEGA